MQFGPDRYWRKDGGLLPATSVLATTRSSDIVLPDSAGMFQTLGNNTLPRTDRGLYANGQVTNLFTHSQEFNDAAWFKGNVTVNGNAALAPDGTLTADQVIESADGAPQNHQIARMTSLSFTSGVTYTLSVFAKENGRTLRLGFPSAAFSGGPLAYFDLVNGAVLSGGSEASIEQLSGGWFRCSFTRTATATASANFISIAPADGTTRDYVGDGTSGLFIWGAQLETGSFAGPYTPTTSTTATTLASDIRVVQGVRPSNGQPEPFPGWEAAGLDDGFTALVRVNIDRPSAANNRTVFQAGSENEFARLDFTTGNRFRMTLQTLQTLGPELGNAALLDKRPGTDGTVTRAGGVINFVNAAVGLSTAISQEITGLSIGATYLFSGRVRKVSGAGGVRLELRTASGGGGSALATSSFIGAEQTSFVDVSVAWVATQTNIHLTYLSPNNNAFEAVEASHSFREVETLTLESDIVGSTGLYDITARFKPGDYALMVSGGIAGDSDSSSAPLPAGATTLRVGSDFGVLNPFNGWIEQIQIARAA